MMDIMQNYIDRIIRLEDRISIQTEPCKYNHLACEIKKLLADIKQDKYNPDIEANKFRLLIERTELLPFKFVRNHVWLFRLEEDKLLVLFFEGDFYCSTLFENHQIPSIGWFSLISILEFLHKWLFRAGKITCAYSEFKSHFTAAMNKGNRIVWNASSYELVKLINWLIVNNFIVDKDSYLIVIFEHFTDQRGKTFNPDSLGTYNGKPYTNASVEQFYEKLFRKLLSAKANELTDVV